ncbi:MAG: OmpA family protein, partial [Lentisphaerae bacterium]|nr:OmpA family protein [Lentisphaerota bacterium]
DERGSDEYNRGLSERRALSVWEYLQTLGVAGDRMKTVSYGEDRPVVANATSESEHQQNRRAEFLLGTKK